MALLSQRILRGLVPARFSADRPPARRVSPDRIVLGVRSGHRPSDKPPVRIFLGTERGQFRAERIFIWSVEKYRDPARIYEIYLLRDLKGFRRRFWLTGFTNYRFAIPEFAGFKGRAIYNDADQVYLTDPGELFDTPMKKAGFLSINDRDTSVMLIDCERMAQAWNAHDVRRLSRKALEGRARQAGLWGDLDDGWNARDSEYQPGRSHLVHFTTLHTQPWRPFPDQFIYFDNPTGELWPEMEREANRAKFMPVSATRPSREWGTIHMTLSARPDGPMLQELLAAGESLRRHDHLSFHGLLEQVPDQDVPWLLERLFRATHHLEMNIREPLVHSGGRYRRSRWFWLQHFRQAGQMHPDTRWSLTHTGPPGGKRTLTGGPAPQGSIAVLLHRKPGHNQQARAIAGKLADQTGRQVKEYRLNCSEATFISRGLLGLTPLPELEPDTSVVVAGGWLPTRTARHLARRNPALRLVLAGRKAGPASHAAGVIIQCRHFGLPPHPHRLLTDLPLNAGNTESRPDQAGWQEWLNAERRAAVLVGGSSRSHKLSREHAKLLARRVSAWAAANNARLLVVTSRRSQRVLAAIGEELAPDDLLYGWKANDPQNPYALALAHSHDLVVTGESESMLADAASCGRGFLIWPLPERNASPWQAFSARVAGRAVRPRFNRRGSIRPQQGLTYLCARALERNWVLPPRRLDQLQRILYERGLAAPFGESAPTSFKQSDELSTTVSQAAELLEIEISRPEFTVLESKAKNEQPTA